MVHFFVAGNVASVDFARVERACEHLTAGLPDIACDIQRYLDAEWDDAFRKLPLPQRTPHPQVVYNKLVGSDEVSAKSLDPRVVTVVVWTSTCDIYGVHEFLAMTLTAYGYNDADWMYGVPGAGGLAGAEASRDGAHGIYQRRHGVQEHAEAGLFDGTREDIAKIVFDVVKANIAALESVRDQEHRQERAMAAATERLVSDVVLKALEGYMAEAYALECDVVRRRYRQAFARDVVVALGEFAMTLSKTWDDVDHMFASLSDDRRKRLVDIVVAEPFKVATDAFVSAIGGHIGLSVDEFKKNIASGRCNMQVVEDLVTARDNAAAGGEVDDYGYVTDERHVNGIGGDSNGKDNGDEADNVLVVDGTISREQARALAELMHHLNALSFAITRAAVPESWRLQASAAAAAANKLKRVKTGDIGKKKDVITGEQPTAGDKASEATAVGEVDAKVKAEGQVEGGDEAPTEPSAEAPAESNAEAPAEPNADATAEPTAEPHTDAADVVEGSVQSTKGSEEEQNGDVEGTKRGPTSPLNLSSKHSWRWRIGR